MTENTEPQDSIWVTSDASGGTTYFAAIHFTPDFSITLTEADGIAYAATLLRASAAAEYDAAMYAQLDTELQMPKKLIAQMITDLRAKRGTWQAGPLKVEPAVSAFTGDPFLRCTVRELTWQWDPADVKQHVRHVMEVAAAVDYDSAYLAYLVDEIGISSEHARAMVADIANFRSAE